MNDKLLRVLKNTDYQLCQYRILTNKLINENISSHNIEKFKEIEYIKDIYKNISDYEYDLYNWLSSDLIKTTVKKIEELKKRLEENKKPLRGIFAQVNDDMLLRSCGAMQSEIDGYKTQQKEFIKYLEKRYKDVTSVISSFGSNTDLLYGKKDMIEEIIQKYKEIIGDDKR